MPVRVRWHDNAHTTIYQELTDPWTVDGQMAASIEMQQMMDSVDHIVHVIGVFKAKKIPDDVLTRLPEINRSAPFNHPRLGVCVVVSSNSLVRSVARIYSMVYDPIQMTRSVGEAEQIIEAWEPH